MKKIICLFLILIPFVGNGQIMGSSEKAKIILILRPTNDTELLYSTAYDSYYLRLSSSQPEDGPILLTLGNKEETEYALRFFYFKIEELKRKEYCYINVGGENICFTKTFYYGDALCFQKENQHGVSYIRKINLPILIRKLEKMKNNLCLN